MLVLADEVGVAEGPGLVERGTLGRLNAGGVLGDAIVDAREESGCVEVGVGLVDVDIGDGAVELGVPGAVGCAGQVKAPGVTGVDGGNAVARQVSEGTGQVNASVDHLRGLHADAPAVAVAYLEVPRGVDLPGRGVDEDCAHAGFAVDLGEVTDGEELAAGQLHEVLDLVVEVEGLAGPVTRDGVEGGQAARGDLLAVLALLHAGEVATHVHGRADLFEGLHLDAALLDRAVEVAGHAPGRGGGEFRHRGLLGFGGQTAVTDGTEGRVRGAQLGADVDLRVGVDDRPVAVEVGGRGGSVVPRGCQRPVAEAHRVLVLRGGRQVDVSPPGVGAEAGPDDAAVNPPLPVELDVDGVSTLERPDEVTHLGELHAHGLVGAATVVPGALDHDAVGQVGDLGAAEESVDGFVGGLNDLEVTGGARAGLESGLIAVALSPGFPAFAASANHDPAAAVRRLVTEELAGGLHRGCLEPVGTVRGSRIVLLNLPAGGRCGRLGEAIVERINCRLSCDGTECKHSETGY